MKFCYTLVPSGELEQQIFLLPYFINLLHIHILTFTFSDHDSQKSTMESIVVAYKSVFPNVSSLHINVTLLKSTLYKCELLRIMVRVISSFSMYSSQQEQKLASYHRIGIKKIGLVLWFCCQAKLYSFLLLNSNYQFKYLYSIEIVRLIIHSGFYYTFIYPNHNLRVRCCICLRKINTKPNSSIIGAFRI